MGQLDSRSYTAVRRHSVIEVQEDPEIPKPVIAWLVHAYHHLDGGISLDEQSGWGWKIGETVPKTLVCDRTKRYVDNDYFWKKSGFRQKLPAGVKVYFESYHGLDGTLGSNDPLESPLTVATVWDGEKWLWLNPLVLRARFKQVEWEEPTKYEGYKMDGDAAPEKQLSWYKNSEDDCNVEKLHYECKNYGVNFAAKKGIKGPCNAFATCTNREKNKKG